MGKAITKHKKLIYKFLSAKKMTEGISENEHCFQNTMWEGLGCYAQ
jgi:hypothetical protein